MKLYNKKDSIRLHHYALGKGDIITNSESLKFHHVDKYTIYPVPKYLQLKFYHNDKIEGYLLKPPFITYSQSITPSTKVYVSKECTFPKFIMKGKCTKVLNPDKADVVVVSSYPTEKIDVFKTYIFKSPKDQLYFIKASGYQLHSMVPDSYPLGTKLNEMYKTAWSPNIKDHQQLEEIIDILESKLVFNDYCFLSDGEDLYKVLSNSYPSIMFADDFVAAMQEDEVITESTIASLTEGLSSPDLDIVGNTLMTMSYMNYSKYHNTFVHMLQTHISWQYSNVKHLTSCNYMLKTLGFTRLKITYIPPFSEFITPEDFGLMKKMVEEKLQEDLDTLKRNIISYFPFVRLNVDATYDISCTKKEDAKND